jgi:PLP dependent protein
MNGRASRPPPEMVTYDTFSLRLDSLRKRMRGACLRCGRAPESVRLLPVTKTHPVEAAAHAARAGLTAVGENRVQEAAAKRPLGPAGLRWELIGHLQSNKAKLAVDTFDAIQSVDSEKLARLLARAALDKGIRLPVLLQINAGNDPAKFGADPENAPGLLEACLASPGLQVEGLMTIAPLSDDPDVARRTFEALRGIRDDLSGRFGHPLPELSMGMTGDLEAAIEAGSTVVRVGTALFGERLPHEN